MTREKLQNRLERLNSEFEKGQTRLRELQHQESQLHETLLRISGAIQVVSELLEQETDDATPQELVQGPDQMAS